MKKERRGSMIIAVLIVMVMVSAIALSLLQRSIKGSSITKSSKQGYSAYQVSDSEAEKILNEIKALDAVTDGKEIPQNMPVSAFCSGFKCYDENNQEITEDASKKISDILEIEMASSADGAKRAIRTPLPSRIYSGIENITVKKCDGIESGCNGSYNQCNLLVSWTVTSNSDVSGYELRRSDKYSFEESNLYGWKLVPSGSANPTNENTKQLLVSNRDDIGIDMYGKDYYFAVKAKNKSNFQLDSLYYSSGGNISIDKDKKCEGSEVLDGLGCTTKTVPGTESAKVLHNCCNDTKCLQVMDGWKESTNGECALQKCLSSDNVSLYPSGNSSTGYCKTAGPTNDGKCKEGEDNNCSGHVYKIIGYCTSCNSGWEKSESRIMDVDYTPSVEKKEARCCRQTCNGWMKPSCGSDPANGKWINNSTCLTNTCGSRTETKICILQCNTNYHTEDQKTCVFNTRYNQACTGLPTNAEWNTVSAITQNWNNGWSPSTAGHYDVSASKTECHYKCKSGYHLDGGQCVSDTKTVTCSGSLPANSTWRTNGKCVQTWNGSSWSPVSCPATHYVNGDNSQCEYTCNGGRVNYNNGCYFSCNRCSTVQNHLWVRFYSTKSDCSVGTYTVERRCDTNCHTPKQPPSAGCYCSCP